MKKKNINKGFTKPQSPISPSKKKGKTNVVPGKFNHTQHYTGQLNTPNNRNFLPETTPEINPNELPKRIKETREKLFQPLQNAPKKGNIQTISVATSLLLTACTVSDQSETSKGEYQPLPSIVPYPTVTNCGPEESCNLDFFDHNSYSNPGENNTTTVENKEKEKSIAMKNKNLDRTNSSELLEYIETTYGISIYRDENIAPEELLQSLQNIQEELDFFSEGFIKGVGVHTIDITSQIQNNERGFCSLEDLSLQYNPIFSAEPGILIHEIFHFLDYLKKALDNEGSIHNDDKSWEQTTPLSQHEYCFEAYTTCNLSLSDFANPHGREDIQEDQATILEELFRNYDDIVQKAKYYKEQEDNPTLSQKIENVKNFMEKITNGRMDKDFWENHKKKFD